MLRAGHLAPSVSDTGLPPPTTVADAPPGLRSSRPPSIQEAEKAFLAAYAEYEKTRALDALRAREFARLDEGGHVYLDYAGGGLYAASQVRRHSELLLGSVLGNPHSTNPASAGSARLVERCRLRILDHFRAPGDEYVVIFTANATQALKLVGESYPFEPGDRLLLTSDNHNSVNGIREFARARGVRAVYAPVDSPELRVDEAVMDRLLEGAAPGHHRLLAYPAQSNFSGVQHPLSWVPRARSRGWDVLLDAAAYVPTNRLDLSQVQPDFVAVSFYKMFGYPTGVGALIARREALDGLRRPWFAGGAVEVASVRADRFQFASGAAAFEDGTVNFTAIPAVGAGLDLVEALGIETIHERVCLLTGWLIEALLDLEHRNGRALVRLYGPAASERRGGTITFNFQDASGRAVDPREIERTAARRRISLRTGCFCNPGAGEAALGLGREELERCFSARGNRMRHDDLRRCIAPRPAGAVRVSFGLVSNFADAWAFREYARGMLS